MIFLMDPKPLFPAAAGIDTPDQRSEFSVVRHQPREYRMYAPTPGVRHTLAVTWRSHRRPAAGGTSQFRHRQPPVYSGNRLR